MTASHTSTGDAQVRARSPRGQGDQLRTDLLAAAAELLAEHGSVERVSLRAVAAKTGVTPTAVYRHFENHDDLMLQAILLCWNDFELALGNEDLDDPSTSFYDMGRGYIRFAEEQPLRYRVLFSPEMMRLPQVKTAGAKVFSKLVNIVETLLAANNDKRDPFFVATQVHTWMHGMVGLCLVEKELDDTMPWPDVYDLLDDLPFRLGLFPNGNSTPHRD